MCPPSATASRAAFLLALLTLPVAAEGQLQAGPALLEIGPEESSTRLLLRNPGPAPIAAQVRVYLWTQIEGEDRLLPGDDLVVSPPILELAPGGEQVVRLVRLGPPANDRDRNYRVVVDELPGNDRAGGSRVDLRMRYVIPAFVRAADARSPLLTCRIESEGTRLACENAGGRAAQLGASRLLDGRGETVFLSDGLFGYVLPASRREWVLPPDRPALDGSTLRLDTRINGQAVLVVVDRPS